MAKRSATEARRRWQGWVELVQRRNAGGEQALREREERIRRAKRDYDFFKRTYLSHLATCETADFQIDLANKVRRNPTIKVLVAWGRGLAKSVECDICIPLWLWINGEDIYMVLIGHTEERAITLLADLREQFEHNELLAADFGYQVTTKWKEKYFVCRERFTAAALGMGQEVRGLRRGSQRPNLIVADDLEDKKIGCNPKRQDEVVDWMLAALLPTMDGPVRRLLVPNNLFAPRTISSELARRNPRWKLHRVDATIGPERRPRWAAKYPEDYYRSVEEDMGTIAFEAEYNNRPWVQGKVFTQEMIEAAWAPLPPLRSMRHITGRWDPAYSGKNDFNAVRVWGLHDHRMYLIAAFVRQRTMNGALDWIHEFERSLPEGVIIHWRVESQFWNEPLRRAIAESCERHGRQLNISVVPSPKSKKLDRLLSVFPYYENGRIRYNEKMQRDADFIEGIRQLLGIEPGYRTHDDAPDADERAIADLAAFDRAYSFQPIIGRYSRAENASSQRY